MNLFVEAQHALAHNVDAGALARAFAFVYQQFARNIKAKSAGEGARIHVF